ncbi:hypothetical protein WMF18_01825 [Sorangium sp. So ce315]|uniref:hypothetical protein n=1 Tax=Sorangium sp. So ce315 TaxID=3133299 RepID=UPI003F5D725B
MRRLMSTLPLALVCGCAPDVLDEGRLAATADLAWAGEGESAGPAPGEPSSSGVVSNGIWPNALRPDSIPSTGLGALRIQALERVVSRDFIRYAIGCALDRAQAITLDGPGGARGGEVHRGEVGLAPEWVDGPLSPVKQRWVSACIAARANRSGVPVMLSMRSQASAQLAAGPEERGAFATREGAFWGNLFSDTPALYTCHVPDSLERARARGRSCATGQDTGSGVVGCGIIQRTGDCASACSAAGDPAVGYAACNGSTEVITTFLE